MKLWQFAEDVLLPFVTATLHVTVLVLWVDWLIRFAVPALPVPAFVAAALLPQEVTAVILVRWAVRRAWPARSRQIVGTVVGCLGLPAVLLVNFGAGPWAGYLSGRASLGDLLFASLTLLLAAAGAWWLGLGLGASTVTRDQLEGAFYGGLAALAALLILNNFGPWLLAGDLVWPILLFLGLGLAALAVMGLRRLRVQEKSTRSEWRAFSRAWIAMALGLIGLVLLSGLLLTGLLAPEAFQRLGQAVAVLYQGLALVLILLMAPALVFLAALFSPLVPWLAEVVRVAFDVLASVINTLVGVLGSLVQAWLVDFPQLLAPERVRAFLESPEFRSASRWTGLGAFLLIAALVFWAALRRGGWLSSSSADEIRESILSRELLLAQLRALLRRPKPAAPPPPYLAVDGDAPRQRVRRAYQALLAWAAARGFPRLAGQTPHN